MSPWAWANHLLPLCCIFQRFFCASPPWRRRFFSSMNKRPGVDSQAAVPAVGFGIQSEMLRGRYLHMCLNPHTNQITGSICLNLAFRAELNYWNRCLEPSGMLQGTPVAPKSYSGRMWASLKSQGISDRSMQIISQRWVFRCLAPMQTHPQVCVFIHEQDPTPDSKLFRFSKVENCSWSQFSLKPTKIRCKGLKGSRRQIIL